MKKAFIVAVLTCTLVLPAYAQQGPGAQGKQQQGPPPQGQAQQGQNFEQKRSEILQHIDQRISNLQSFKSCVQAAKTHDDLRSCRQKYVPQNQNQNQNH